VDPEDPEALAGGILRVLAEPALAADLARRGRERARLFTWDRAAGETLAAYRSVL
jgi:glycosyltransferase involved in cell wall biosynthesis